MLTFLARVAVESQFEWLDANGKSLGSIGPSDQYEEPVLSHRGDRVAYLRIDPAGGGRSIWVLDLTRGTSNRLVESPVGNGLESPVWSPDDSAVFYCENGSILRQRLAGGPPETLFRAADSEHADVLLSMRDVRVSADSQFLLFVAWDPVSDFDLWMLRLDDSSGPRRLVGEAAVQSRPQISPDTRWVAYEASGSGRTEVYVRSTDPEQASTLISTDGGSSPRWSKDGHQLRYISSEHALMAVTVKEDDGRLTVGLPKRLFTAPLAVSSESNFELFRKPRPVGAHDGRFLFQVPAERVPPRTITVVLNWERRMAR
ncbi:MAG: hypothetical protein DRJ50_11535 [Actinobacteria bacterium]|nr:MAG: hypothetical protein DRJ50_11535 [Actinomycetota bacterium]